MAHEIDEMAPGIHAFVSAREDAWHRLGVTLDRGLTAEDAMTVGMLGGWNVRKIPLTAHETTDDGVTAVEVPDRYASVRTNPATGATEYLGIVGGHYVPIQNEEHADLLNALVDESGAHFETAGSLRGGKHTFITMKLPDHLAFGGTGDPIDLYIVALNGHDGNTAFRFMVSPVRVVCANTQDAAIRGAKSSFSIRHVTNPSQAITEARHALDLTFKYVEEFEAAANRLVEQGITDRKAKDLLAQLFELDGAESKRAHAQRAQKASDVFFLWKESDTLEGLRSNRYGLYQAVTEYVDHYAPTNNIGGRAAAESRALRSLSNMGKAVKESAWSLVSAK